jgi:hypothetical protein
LIADLGMKIQSQGVRRPEGGRYSAADLGEMVFVPHSNLHLQMIGQLGESITGALSARSISVVEIDHPGFVLCDEPLMVDPDEVDVRHHSDCRSIGEADGAEDRAERRRRARARREPGDLFHLANVRGPGLLHATEIVLPLDPCRVLVFGPIGPPSPSLARFSGSEAREIAAEQRRWATNAAYAELYASPGTVGLDELVLGAEQPMYEVCGVDDRLAAHATAGQGQARPGLLRDGPRG